MRTILGLDLGTNSIGWALIDDENKKIIRAGCRIIPMDGQAMSNYETGNLQSSASVRTSFRGTRRLYQRAELRRERLLRVLNIMGFLPEHFKNQIDFIDHPGQFKNHSEPLLPYRKNKEGRNEFIFMDSFNEMLADFKVYHPELLANGKKIPYDWTIYFLRHKALSHPISRQELAWIILNFNTKRGYYQLRGNDETETKEGEEYKVLKVTKVEDTGADKKRKNMHWFEITYEGDIQQRRLSVAPPKSVGDTAELIVTTKTKKDGSLSISLREPKEGDWTLMKKRTESIINHSGQTVGDYIYTTLLKEPDLKIRGNVVRTIERKYYKDELIKILETQKEFIPELQSHSLMVKCVNELYHQNEAHRNAISKDSFTRFIVDDIIFYQRPLKSKKGEIADCPFEKYRYKDDEGNIIEKGIKCTSKSDPLFQEFRLWQFIQNLKIFAREKEVDGKLRTDVDVTRDFIKGREDIVALFEWLRQQKEITQDKLLKSPIFDLGRNASRYRWNYVEERAYPCCPTHAEILFRLSKVKGAPTLSHDQEMNLWHILYSVDDAIDLEKALGHYAEKNRLDICSFKEAFKDMEPFDDDYAAYSQKAIKKLLPLMRCGKYWDGDKIDSHTRQRIDNIIDGVVDDNISDRVREKAVALRNLEDFQYLPLWMTSYIVYNRHSETSDTSIWRTPEDIDNYLSTEFKQHSLRNPVVESVIGEAIRVVRDIWKTYGEISEVHIEMGRDLKQTKDQRAKTNERVLRNQNTNIRIKRLLSEFVKPQYHVENVRPQSPSQAEILKIYEDGILNSGMDVPDDIETISRNLGNLSKEVSGSDIMRYRLWLEQGYQSPYTGQPIPLSKLFTTAYEIEHVIPQSRFFDDSISNKVICESEVNKAKGKMLGYEFIRQQGGAIIDGNGGKHHKILDARQYEDFVKQHYSNNRGKLKKLLMDEIPDDFIQRQLNDSRYIARKALEIFSHLVRGEDEQEAISKNVVSTNGSITTRLKKDWGMNDVWNDIVGPRFERMNRITKSEAFGSWVNKDGKRYFQTDIPLELSRNFSKKRIDHRHHAMDAIVIACTTKDHVNYLNNSAALSSKGDMRYDLQHKLCDKIKTDDKGNYVWCFRKPWKAFTQDAHRTLDGIIASFKQNLRVINKMTNYYWKYIDGKKQLVRQTKGDGWAVRKSLHKATVSGAVRLQRKKMVRLKDALGDISTIADKDVRKAIKDVVKLYHGNIDNKTLLKYFKDRQYKAGNKDISKVEVYYLPEKADMAATRVPVDAGFDQKTINSVTDSGIRTILTRHLQNYRDLSGKDHPELAFSPEGLAKMNENIQELNGGKLHKPIVKVRKFEPLGLKFNVGEYGTKQEKYVEADKGTNLFFAVYTDEDGNRSYDSIPFNIAVERMKNGLHPAESKLPDGRKLLFTLSPYDLVVLQHDGEWNNQLFRFVSSTGNRAFFVPVNVSSPIADKLEYGKSNKIELTDDRLSFKQYCIKVRVDRLGNIINP
ncbi:MAG: HNH endonuclease domain-containing protein [Prevotella sp.]|nr:HNH endonuclease domain-containing protein [Prevotella sp.]